MDHFTHKNNILHAEDIAVTDIAKKVGTPFYCYSVATITRHYKIFSSSFDGVDSTVCFAVKANSNQAILKTLGDLGAGGDCVSKGEIMRCLKAGINPQKIVFSGVGKTADEMRYALKNKILQINVESEEELILLNEVALSLGLKANIAFRVNPDVDAGTHDKIATGRKEDKFGISYDNILDVYKKAADMNGINVQGVATHIGSQLTSLEPFRKAFTKIKNLVLKLREDGHKITHLDLGGGLGIPYQQQDIPSPAEYGKMVVEIFKDLGCKLAFEPGRLICGNAGILISSVLYLKKTAHRNFLVIDAAMNDLIRPTLYDAHHEIVSVDKTARGEVTMDVVGPVCETGDVFGKNRKLPDFANNELVAIRSCGAYGAVMSCEYNSRPLIPEVLVNGDKFAIIRKRPSLEEMIARDSLPDWL